MRKSATPWIVVWLAVMVGSLLFANHAHAAEEGRNRHLVTPQWLTKNLGQADLLVLDASVTPLFAKQHIAGAVSADLYRYGAAEPSAAAMERRIQSWGVNPGQRIVIYDQGGSMMATRLFYDLYRHGVPAENLLILDGGLAKWLSSGGAVTKDPTAAKAGSFRISKAAEDAVRVRLPEFLHATGDTANHTVVEALEPSYHFGETKFFDRAGHVPNAVMLPSEDFYNADKTFKSPQQIATMLRYLGIRPEQQIHTHCGGGVAASVPFFAMKFILDYPKVKLYLESQLEWLQDERELPFWTYDAPALKRDMQWLNGWSNRMLRSFGVTRISVIDVRPAEAFAQGHVPFALSIPADVFRSHLGAPEKLAALLGPAGVDAAHEAVIVSDGGLNARSALAFVALERMGQKKVSILMDSVDEWGLRGLPLTKEATAIGPKSATNPASIPPTTYPAAALRSGLLIGDPAATQGAYPKVYLASGKSAPAKAVDGKQIHVPYTSLLNADGTPKPAKDIWSILTKAGLPRYAEIVCHADDPGEAAVNYYLLKLMGYPDVKVWTPG